MFKTVMTGYPLNSRSVLLKDATTYELLSWFGMVSKDVKWLTVFTGALERRLRSEEE